MIRSVLAGILLITLAAGSAAPRQVEPWQALVNARCRSADGRSYTSVGAPVDGAPINEAGLACTIPYPDGGKICSDRAECQGYCEVDRDKFPKAKSGDVVTGKCQVMRFPLGDHEVVEKRRMKHLLIME